MYEEAFTMGFTNASKYAIGTCETTFWENELGIYGKELGRWASKVC